MYPLQVVLVNCGETIRSSIRRHLANQLAIIRAEHRSVGEAIEAYRDRGADEQLLFVFYLRSTNDLADLQRLNAALPHHTILVLKDRDSDPSLFQKALRCGAVFSVPVPIDPEDLRTILNWIARDLGLTPRPTTVIAVAATSGGSGATSVAVTLADDIAARQGRTCLLIELSLRMGVLATHLQLQPRYTIHDALRELDHLDMQYFRQALTPAGERLHVLAGPQQAIHSREVSPQDVLRLLFQARPLADVVVVDLPAGYDDLYFDVLAYADHIALIWDQKLASVRALQMVRAVLQRREVSVDRQHLIVNRYDPTLAGFKVPELEKLLQVSGLLTVSNDSAAMTAAANNGRPLRLEAPRSKALADISALASHILGRSPGQAPAAVTQPGVFGRLVRRFGLNS